MKKIQDYIAQFTAPSAGFSYGRLKNNSGSGDGSEVVIATHNDLLYALYAPIIKYLGDASGTDESESASDMQNALERIANLLGPTDHIASYDYYQGNYILRDGIVWRANANIDTGVDGTDFISQYNAGRWDSQVLLNERDPIYGFSMANNVVDPNNDLDIGSGQTYDLTTGDIIDAISMTKRIDALWSAGTAAGMLDAGAVAADTTYFLYVIKKDDDSSGDYLASTSPTSPTMPAGYTMKRLIRAFRTDPGGATIMPGVWVTRGNNVCFDFDTVQVPISGVAIATVQTNYNMISWAGIECYAKIHENPGRDDATVIDDISIAFGPTDTTLTVSASNIRTYSGSYRGTCASRDNGGTDGPYVIHNMQKIRIDASEQIAGIKNTAPYFNAATQTTVQQFTIEARF